MASHDELNRDTGLRCAVELLNHPNIVKGVHLGDNASVAVRLLIGNLDADQLLETAPHIARGDDERLILLLRCVPGDEMKQVDEVSAYILLCRKVTEIRIETRRDRIVVAEIGRASCREREYISVKAVAYNVLKATTCETFCSCSIS